MKPNPLWKEQCAVTRQIRERFGSESALRYLVGEKFVGFLLEARTNPAMASDAADFLAAITRIFPPEELDLYLRSMNRSKNLEPPKRDATVLRRMFFGNLRHRSSYDLTTGRSH